MITYVAKSSVVSASNTPTLLVAADRDRTHLEFTRKGNVYLGGSDVSVATGYIIPTMDIPIRLEGISATSAVYGITSAGSIDVAILEIVPDL
jgi:hypothetical protein